MPEGLLNKDMRFGLLSWIEAIRAVVAALATLVLAYLATAIGPWCGETSIGTVVRTTIIMVARPFRFALPRIAGMQKGADIRLACGGLGDCLVDL